MGVQVLDTYLSHQVGQLQRQVDHLRQNIVEKRVGFFGTEHLQQTTSMGNISNHSKVMLFHLFSGRSKVKVSYAKFLFLNTP